MFWGQNLFKWICLLIEGEWWFFGETLSLSGEMLLLLGVHLGWPYQDFESACYPNPSLSQATGKL